MHQEDSRNSKHTHTHTAAEHTVIKKEHITVIQTVASEWNLFDSHILALSLNVQKSGLILSGCDHIETRINTAFHGHNCRREQVQELFRFMALNLTILYRQLAYNVMEMVMVYR